MQKDLEFIAQVVTAWPLDAEYVRLDSDGEVCFRNAQLGDLIDYDFYPKDRTAAREAFVGTWALGKEYTYQEWEEARNEFLE